MTRTITTDPLVAVGDRERPVDSRDPTDADRLEHALEMWADGVCMMRESLRRRHPTAPPVEIEAALDVWLATRPGAERGDGEGVSVSWPRTRR